MLRFPLLIFALISSWFASVVPCRRAVLDRKGFLWLVQMQMYHNDRGSSTSAKPKVKGGADPQVSGDGEIPLSWTDFAFD